MPPAIAWFAMRIMNQAMAGGMYLADRKSTRLNSSHSQISYAVFCLKKKKAPRREARRLSRVTDEKGRPVINHTAQSSNTQGGRRVPTEAQADIHPRMELAPHGGDATSLGRALPPHHWHVGHATPRRSVRSTSPVPATCYYTIQPAQMPRSRSRLSRP